MPRIRTIEDVVDYRLCIGCGACLYVLGPAAGQMTDIPHVGLRPQFSRQLDDDENAKALSVCPGVLIDAHSFTEGVVRDQDDLFDHPYAGRGLAMWEGYASDPEIRFAGSSGGVITALGLYSIERAGVEFVSHVGMDTEQPWKNRNIISRTRSELLRGLGSRYAPSSPCLSLSEIEAIEGRAVFVGKPCDAAAVTRIVRQKPELGDKIAAVITFFCAGTPSSAAAAELLHANGVAVEHLQSVKYRGQGWPGRFRALDRGGGEVASISYAESWGELQRSRGLRCSLCADGMGEVADIACGDAWHRYAGDGNPGVSVIIARTQRGLKLVEGARRAGYLTLKRAAVDAVISSQGSGSGLIRRRSEVWGRLFALRLCRVAAPEYIGIRLFHAWMQAPVWSKIRSVLGTIRRVVRKKLRQRLKLHE